MTTTVFSKSFFTLAITANASRWALLSATVHWSGESKQKMQYYLKVALVFATFLLICLSIADAEVNCMIYINQDMSTDVNDIIDSTLDGI